MTESLPVRTRRILAADGSKHESLYVACPGRMRSMDLDACRTCAHAQKVSTEVVECSPVVPAPTEARSWAGSIAPLSVTCVRANVVTASLSFWAPPEASMIPVVDTDSRFIGFVSSTQPIAVATTARLAMALPVSELVFGTKKLAVLESDSAEYALRVMAHCRASVVAVVDDSGTPRGVLRDIEALRAMARRARAGSDW